MSGAVYLGCPIDGARGLKARISDLRYRARQAMRGQVAIFDPSLAWLDGQLGAKSVVQINTDAVRRCQGLFAILPMGVATVGVPMEIEQGMGLGLPVVVAGGQESTQIKGLGAAGRLVRVEEDEVEIGVKLLLEEMKNRRLLGDEGGQGRQIVRWAGAREMRPRRGLEGDAGVDLYVAETSEIGAGEFEDVACGVSVELPPGVWARITGRSSTLRRRRLLVIEGIIDQGYRGALFCGVLNLNGESVKIERGERLAQLIPHRLVDLEWEMVEEGGLAESARGEQGFGSTGS